MPEGVEDVGSIIRCYQTNQGRQARGMWYVHSRDPRVRGEPRRAPRRDQAVTRALGGEDENKGIGRYQGQEVKL